MWTWKEVPPLIHSMIYGYAIPAMYFTRDENKIYDSLMESSGVMQSVSLSVTSLHFPPIRLLF